MSITKIYVKEFRKNIATFHPVWQPGDQIRIGAFGIIKDSVFVPQGHLSNLLPDVSLKASSNHIDGSLSFHSDQGFSSKTDIKAETIAGPAAEADLSFSDAGGVFFRANDIQQKSLTNISDILSAIDGRPIDWPAERVFVWEIQEAREALVLIASSGSWQVKASADAPTISGLNLAKAGVELKTIHGQGYSRQLPAAGDRRHPIALRMYGLRGFFSPSWELLGVNKDAEKWIDIPPDQLPDEV